MNRMTLSRKELVLLVIFPLFIIVLGVLGSACAEAGEISLERLVVLERGPEISTLKHWLSLNSSGWLDPETRHFLQIINVFVALLLFALLIVSYLLRRRLKEKVAHLKSSQQKVMEQTELLRLATEVAQAGIWDIRPITKTVYLSAQWRAMLGYPPEDKALSFAEFEHFVYPEDFPRITQFSQKHILDKGQKQFEAEYRLRRADDTWCWFLSKGKAVEWDENGIPSRIIGLDLNIQAIKETREKIAQSERRIREIIDNAPFGAHNYMLDPEGQLIFCGGNPAKNKLRSIPYA